MTDETLPSGDDHFADIVVGEEVVDVEFNGMANHTPFTLVLENGMHVFAKGWAESKEAEDNE